MFCLALSTPGYSGMQQAMINQHSVDRRNNRLLVHCVAQNAILEEKKVGGLNTSIRFA